jgi:hemerythrin superfamily protein
MNPFKEFFNGMGAMNLEGRTDVISLIKADHRKVDELFKQYMDSSDDAEKESILQEIINDLRVHASAEETKVYPILDTEDHDGANESREEHHLIKILIEELSSNRLAEDKIDAKVKVLSEVVKHHVKEEETKYLPELKDSGADLDLLGENFTTEKERLMGEPDMVAAPVETTDESMFRRVPDAVLADDAREVKASAAKKAPLKKEPAKKVEAKKAPARKVTAKKVGSKTADSKKVAAKPLKKESAKKEPAKKLSAVKMPTAKKVTKPAARRKAS